MGEPRRRNDNRAGDAIAPTYQHSSRSSPVQTLHNASKSRKFSGHASRMIERKGITQTAAALTWPQQLLPKPAVP